MIIEGRHIQVLIDGVDVTDHISDIRLISDWEMLYATSYGDDTPSTVPGSLTRQLSLSVDYTDEMLNRPWAYEEK